MATTTPQIILQRRTTLHRKPSQLRPFCRRTFRTVSRQCMHLSSRRLRKIVTILAGIPAVPSQAWKGPGMGHEWTDAPTDDK
jgi:hypothetical protein